MQLRRVIASMVIFGLWSAQLVLAADLSLQIWNSTDGKHVEDLQRNPFPPLARTILGNSGSEGRKTLVPDFLASIEAMHKHFGKLPFQQIFQPAIWYAEKDGIIAPWPTV